MAPTLAMARTGFRPIRSDKEAHEAAVIQVKTPKEVMIAGDDRFRVRESI